MNGQSTKEARALQAGFRGAVCAMVGILLSGPLGLLLVGLVRPQPPWQGAWVFSENFHVIQIFPFFGGIALVLGFVLLMAALYHLSSDQRRTTSLAALVITVTFATLIFFNYVCQTTFVPALVRDYRPEYEPLIAAFSFSNPDSLCWAIEMWGYGLLGLATWLAAPVFGRGRLENAIRVLMIANGIISIAGALIASYNLRWVFSTTGLASYVMWNVVVLALTACVIGLFRRRMKTQPES